MADLLDNFDGSSGALTSHTADSGDTWTTPNSAFAATTPTIDGSGSVYAAIPTVANGGFLTALSSWTPPGTNYAVTVTIGAGFRTLGSGGALGGFLRATGGTSWTGYAFYLQQGTPDTIQIQNWHGNSNAFSCGQIVGAIQNLASQIVTGDEITVTISGTVTVSFVVYRNRTQIYAVNDGSACARITATGKPALLLSLASGTTGTDFIRKIWAGSITDFIRIPPSFPDLPRSILVQ